MKKGKIFLIEGTDKSGKQTQSKLLVSRLNEEGFPSEIMSFPRYNTPTGRIVGQCYLGKENLGLGDVAWFGDADSVKPKIATLYYLADQGNALEEIKEIIASGRNLVLDRYIEASMGHQGGKAKTPEEREKIIDFVYNVGYNELGLPHPDKTIFLYMPFGIGVRLRDKMSEKPDGHEKNLEHLKNAEECYIYLAKRFGWKKINCAPNGFPPRKPEDIHEELYEYVKNSLKE